MKPLSCLMDMPMAIMPKKLMSEPMPGTMLMRRHHWRFADCSQLSLSPVSRSRTS